jgi:hypothetical protein
VKAITDTLGVARSNVIERVRATRVKRGPQTRDGDLELAAEIRARNRSDSVPNVKPFRNTPRDRMLLKP